MKGSKLLPAAGAVVILLPIGETLASLSKAQTHGIVSVVFWIAVGELAAFDRRRSLVEGFARNSAVVLSFEDEADAQEFRRTWAASSSWRPQ